MGLKTLLLSGIVSSLLTHFHQHPNLRIDHHLQTKPNQETLDVSSYHQFPCCPWWQTSTKEFSFFPLLTSHVAYGIFIPLVEPIAPALKGQSLNHPGKSPKEFSILAVLFSSSCSLLDLFEIRVLLLTRLLNCWVRPAGDFDCPIQWPSLDQL